MTRVVPPLVYLHLFAALAARVLGSLQPARVKGTSLHKAMGWAWVALMLTIAVNSLWIPAFHAGTMKWTYIGGLVIAGAFTLVPGRLLGDLVWKGCWAC